MRCRTTQSASMTFSMALSNLDCRGMADGKRWRSKSGGNLSRTPTCGNNKHIHNASPSLDKAPTHTHKHTDKQTPTQTQTLTQPHTQSDTVARQSPHTHTDTLTHGHQHRHRHSHIHIHKATPSLDKAPAHTDTQTHRHTDNTTHTQAQTQRQEQVGGNIASDCIANYAQDNSGEAPRATVFLARPSDGESPLPSGVHSMHGEKYFYICIYR